MINGEKITLGIETSCDETSAAVLMGGRKILSNIIATQIPVHRKFGGVVPEIASRKHIVSILPVIDEALHAAGVGRKEVDQIAVAYGPGLVGALLVGVSAAKALSYSLEIPLIAVHHLEGHIFANFLSSPNLAPPFVALVVSGGHTALVKMEDYEDFSMMGQTRDDAAGEAFDKVARVLGLPYPGGPEIDRMAKAGNPLAIDFPRALQEKGNHEFSFSGLKSAVLNYINQERMRGNELSVSDIAASFQHTVVEILAYKTFDALEETGLKTLVLAGGVAANSTLASRLRKEAEQRGIDFHFPGRVLCTDNAAMIACRGYYQSLAGKYSDLHLNAVPGLCLGHRGA